MRRPWRVKHPAPPPPSWTMGEIERALEILEIILREDPKATVWALPLILTQMDEEPWRSIRPGR